MNRLIEIIKNKIFGAKDVEDHIVNTKLEFVSNLEAINPHQIIPDKKNIKRRPITDKFVDSQGNEHLRGESSDFESLPNRHIHVLNNVIPGFQKDKDFLKLFESVGETYQRAHFEEAIKTFDELLRKEPKLEEYLFYYIRVCNRVSSLKPLNRYSENQFRCKWCGNFTAYVDPNEPTFGMFSDSNSCSICGRMYPMPSWMWDSPDGRSYSYYRESFIDVEFYEEFESDYKPQPYCNRRKK